MIASLLPTPEKYAGAPAPSKKQQGKTVLGRRRDLTNLSHESQEGAGCTGLVSAVLAVHQHRLQR